MQIHTQMMLNVTRWKTEKLLNAIMRVLCFLMPKPGEKVPGYVLFTRYFTCLLQHTRCLARSFAECVLIRCSSFLMQKFLHFCLDTILRGHGLSSLSYAPVHSRQRIPQTPPKTQYQCHRTPRNAREGGKKKIQDRLLWNKLL